MNSSRNSLSRLNDFKQPIWQFRPTKHTRLVVMLGLLGLVAMMLAGCSNSPAVAQAAQLVSTSEPRQLIIEDREDVYISVANATEQVRLEDWLAAGWTVGKALGAEEDVPHDCVLHTREGLRLQIFARCPGPRQVAVPRDAADFVYVLYLMGKVNQSELDMTMTPQSVNRIP